MRKLHIYFSSSDLSERDSNEIIELSISKGPIVEKKFGRDFHTYLAKEVPQIYNEAISSSNASFSKEAIRSKMDYVLTYAQFPLFTSWLWTHRM